MNSALKGRAPYTLVGLNDFNQYNPKRYDMEPAFFFLGLPLSSDSAYFMN
jgi:hypothetical protein